MAVSSSLALLISIAVVLILIRKINIGLALFAGSAILAYLSFGFDGFIIMLKALANPQTIEIAVMVILAFTLGYSMEYFGLLNRVASGLSESFGAYSFLLIPLLIGLLPMPGGALISAVMLAPLAKMYKISPEKATLLNYWFRHIWVTFWPLYPNVIIGAAVVNVDYLHFASATFPIGIFAMLSGLILTKGMERRFRISGDTVDSLVNLYPIAILLVFSVFLKISLLLSLLIAIATLCVHKRAKFSDFVSIFRKTIDRKIIMLVFAVMVYKSVIETSGAAKSIFADISGFPAPLAAFLLTFLVGFATGIEMSYSSIALPLLTSFTGSGVVIAENLMIVIAAGYLGVMLSPMHLCYILTAEYFGTEIGKTYRQLLTVAMVTAVLVWVTYLVI
uniref:TIGR00529 family membrane protein n=1 Tax=Archaeoglobus fulgidus TaxID=2234 RepID=A0A7C3MGT9_ARCFL